MLRVERQKRLDEIQDEITARDKLIEFNEEQFSRFMLSDKPGTFILHPHSVIPSWIYKKGVFSLDSVTYTKTDKDIVKFGAEKLVFFKRNGEPDFFVGHFSAEFIKKMIRYGLRKLNGRDNPPPTRRAISALGGYHRIVLKRIYEDGIVSNKYAQKKALMDFTQLRIEKLQVLERLTNSYDNNISLEQNWERLVRILREYKSQISQLDLTELGQIESHDKDIIKKMISHLRSERARIDDLIDKIRFAREGDLRVFLSPTGPGSIMTFVKNSIKHVVRQAQKFNQNMTYARLENHFLPESLLRGEFNSVCEDALKEVEDYRADPHNKIVAAHQGDFLSDHPEELIGVDFSYLGRDTEAIQETLRVISHLKEKDFLGHDDKDGYYIKLPHSYDDHKELIENKKRLITTKAVNWISPASEGVSLRRIFAFVLNLVTGLIMAPFDLVRGLIGGLLNYPVSSWAEALRIRPKESIISKDSFYSKLAAKMKIKTESLGVTIGRLVGNFLRNFTWEVFKGAAVTAKNLFVLAREVILDDYYLGHHPLPSEQVILQQVNDEIEQLRQGSDKAFQDLRLIALKYRKKQFQEAEIPVVQGHRWAAAPYELSSGEWDDAFNAMMKGGKVFLETFSHSIHTKHPFTGIIFNLVYATGILAVSSPGFASFLPENYKIFSDFIGKAMSQSGFLAANSSGLTQAQIISTAFQGMLHGRQSWMANFSTRVEQAPSDAVIYFLAAVSFGHLIIYNTPIASIREGLQEEMGNAKVLSEATIGGKMGLLIYEILETRGNEEGARALHRERLEEDLRQELEVQYRKTHDHLKNSPNTPLSEDELNEVKKAFIYLKDKVQVMVNGDLFKSVNDQGSTLLELAAFHAKLSLNSDVLPHLHHTTKRELLEVIKNKFHNRPEVIDELKNKLYPPSSLSIFARTVVLILNHIPLISPGLWRCMLSPITKNSQPWIEHKQKIKKDLTRIVNAFGFLAQTLGSFLRQFTRGIADVIGNEIFARLESGLRGRGHAIASVTYAASAAYDSSYETIRQKLSRPLDRARAEVVYPDSGHLSQEFYQALSQNTAMKMKRQNDEIAGQGSTRMDQLGLVSPRHCDSPKLFTPTSERARRMANPDVFGSTPPPSSSALQDSSFTPRGAASCPQ